MTGRLRYSEAKGKWVIDQLPPHVIIRLKQIFPRIPQAQAQPYIFKNTLENAVDLAWFDSRYDLEMTALDRMTLENMCHAQKAARLRLERIFVGDYSPLLNPGWREINPNTGLKNELRPHQNLSINVLSQSRGLLCADEVGLGKTYTGVGACLIQGALPAAVVCYPHLQRQWKKVIESLTNLRVVEINKTKVHNVPPADIYIFRYTQLGGWADHFGELKLQSVIFDEIQDLRAGMETQKGKGAARLRDQCMYRLGLSATPIYNYGVEIWNIIQFLQPDLLGPRDDFMREWAPNGHVREPAALSAFMKEKGAFIRHTKADVGQKSEKPNRITQEIGFDEQTMRDAESLARRLAIQATTGSFAERGQAAMELDARLRQATGIAKAKGIASFIRIVVESGRKVLVGLWHREVYAILLRELKDLRPVMYTGSESAKQKRDSVDTFLNPFNPDGQGVEGGSDILLMSDRSGAGLDGIQKVCSTAVIGELDWSPGVHHQLIGRLDREGQEEPVTAFFLTVDEGSDPVLMDVNGLKLAEQTAIIDSDIGVQAVHTDISALQKLVQRYIKA